MYVIPHFNSCVMPGRIAFLLLSFIFSCVFYSAKAQACSTACIYIRVLHRKEALSDGKHILGLKLDYTVMFKSEANPSNSVYPSSTCTIQLAELVFFYWFLY